MYTETLFELLGMISKLLVRIGCCFSVVVTVQVAVYESQCDGMLGLIPCNFISSFSVFPASQVPEPLIPPNKKRKTQSTMKGPRLMVQGYRVRVRGFRVQGRVFAVLDFGI